MPPSRYNTEIFIEVKYFYLGNAERNLISFECCFYLCEVLQETTANKGHGSFYNRPNLLVRARPIILFRISRVSLVFNSG